MATYDYTASSYHTDFSGNLDSLHDFIAADATVGSKFMDVCWHAGSGIITAKFSSALDGGEQTALTAVFDDWELKDVKQRLFVRVDAKARDNISTGPGFEWTASSGNYLSLTTNAQLKWLALYNIRTSLSYPVKVRTKDDKTQVSLANATAVADAYAAGMAEVVSLLNAAQVVKNNVNNAADVAAANAAAADYLS